MGSVLAPEVILEVHYEELELKGGGKAPLSAAGSGCNTSYARPCARVQKTPFAVPQQGADWRMGLRQWVQRTSESGL